MNFESERTTAVTTCTGECRVAGRRPRPPAPLAARLTTLTLLLVVAGCGERPPSKESLGNALLDSANAHLVAGRVDDARRHVMEALRAARRSGDRLDEANSLLLLGRVALESRAWQDASAAFDESRALYREVGDGFSEGVALLGSAKAFTSAGDDSVALAIYANAVEHGSRIREPSIEADAWLGIGMIEAGKRPETAREAFGRAARLYRSAGLPEESRQAAERARRRRRRPHGARSRRGPSCRGGSASVRPLRTHVPPPTTSHPAATWPALGGGPILARFRGGRVPGAARSHHRRPA